MGLVLACEGLATPFIIGFNPDRSTLWTLYMVSSIVFWTLDICLNFISGFHEAGGVVLDPVAIAVRYVKTWLCNQRIQKGGTLMG